MCYIVGPIELGLFRSHDAKFGPSMSSDDLDVEAVFKRLKELGARPMHATDFVVDFLARTNRTATTAEIRAALRDAGISIKDSSLNWTLTNLNSRGYIQRVSRGRYRVERSVLKEADELASLGRLDQALAAYEEAIRLFPANVVGYIGRAEALRSMGRHADALAAYEEAIERFHPNAPAYSGRAEALRSMGRFEDALAAYEKAIDLFPADPVAYSGRAEALRSMGRFEDALVAYSDTIERFPDDMIAKNGRAEVLRELGRFEARPSTGSMPPPPEAIPGPVHRAFQFVSAANGPIDLAALSQTGEHLAGGPSRQEDYGELRRKASEVAILGSNRLGRLHEPVDRFLNLGDVVDQVRAKLFWSRINTLRIVLLSHEQGAEARDGEPDDRRLEPTVASLLKDLVETVNVFVVGDPGLLELDAVRPGPQEAEIAKEEGSAVGPLIDDLTNNPEVATTSAQEILREQAQGLETADTSLPGRQAAEFGRRSIQNFVGELLRRAYAPVQNLSRQAAFEAGIAWKGVREGAYRAVGAGIISGAVTDLIGITDFSGAIVRFVARHAELLTAYVMKAFQNPMIVEIINWIVRFGS